MKHLSTALVFLLYTFFIYGQTPELIFYSGFESDTVISIPGNLGKIICTDTILSDYNDWERDLEGHPNIGYFAIVYTRGDDTMRLAKIVPSPDNATNKVLHSCIKYPDEENGKGRVEVSISEIKGIKSLYSSQMMYLPSDFKLVKTLPFKVDWLSVLEYWNNPNWTNDPYPFRITIGIENSITSTESLHFGIQGQRVDNLENIWETVNTSFAIPLEKWLKMESYFTEGDDKSGRYTLIVTPEGGSPVMICDINNYTHHPDDPSPDGLTHFDIMKLYTSARTVNSLRHRGACLNLFWDDLELWKDSSYSKGFDMLNK